tara:strand:- start:2926 stop:3180 length:255 start_codon:yes stop_codon:yes gene_type:complete
MIDLGEKCVECKESVAAGSGRFVNRIPADNGDHIGFLCPDCQTVECDECGHYVLEPFYTENCDVFCSECFERQGFSVENYGGAI